MRIDRVWAMPNRWTFTIKPIRELIEEEMGEGLWIDPFAGKASPATIRNDLNPEREAEYHETAHYFLSRYQENSVDGCFFDPPYSPAKVKQCYEGIGTPLTGFDTSMKFWSTAKDEIARVVKPGGKVISCGWNSNGIGKGRGFELVRLLIVPHGGAKNDTITTVEVKK
jgi:hypothetical protein